MIRLLKLTAASALLLGCAACATIVPPPQASAAAQSTKLTTKLTASTPSYDLALDLSGPQKMYSTADYHKLQPSTGEVLISGKMAAASQLPPGNALYHLDLHVLHVFSDTPIKGASVSIEITSPALKAPIHLPIAVVQSARPGSNEWLYGNNVALAPGNYTVNVVVNAERTTFHLAVVK